MAKGVHFRGTVSSVQGYAVGAAGSETMVIDTNGAINVTNLTATTVNITTLTAATAVLAASTANTITIGGVITGLNNAAQVATYNNLTSATVTVANGVIMVNSIGAALYHSVTLAPTGGYLGQEITFVLTAGGTGGVVSFANTNITVVSTGAITVTGTSVYTVSFVRGTTKLYETGRTAAQS